jgi:lipopolysaccharide export system ATP-binding protein
LKITAENLVKIYKSRKVVNNISLEVNQGEIVGLLGPNGAGKTTTFYMIVGLVKPNGGKVFLDEKDITRLPMYRRAQLGISYLPQEASVFRNLTVEENLLQVLEMKGLSAKACKERAEKLMEDLHITHRREDFGKTLSGGERRRVEIARSLASEPKFILLDEPFTGVDPKAIDDIETILYRLTGRDNIGVLITDHNVDAMLRIAQRAYIVADGEKRTEGSAQELLHDPIARSAYFGERMGLHRLELDRLMAEEELREASRVWEAETEKEAAQGSNHEDS